MRCRPEMLKQADIAHYLLSLGLVKPRAVVDGEITVVDASRRNCVFLAVVHGGPTYVVKQASRWAAPTLAHEAAVLRALAETTELATQVPTVVHYEPQAALLVLGTQGYARDWHTYLIAARFPRTPARALGRTLANLHRIPADFVEDLPHGVDPMWGLSLPEPPHKLLLDLSGGSQDLVARLQSSRALCSRLDELRGARSDRALIHGDLRWENCLAVAAPGSRRKTRVLLVDWELAGPGPPAFDVGTVFAEYLYHWVGSIPIVEPADPGRLVSHARHPLARMQPAVNAFWSAYRGATTRRPTLRHVMELAAVRLLQTAVEGTQRLVTPSAHVVTLVQLADNMLRRPEDAAMNLLGVHT
jgi:aminoglycoside phosphotransferase (APT) family kinase protein